MSEARAGWLAAAAAVWVVATAALAGQDGSGDGDAVRLEPVVLRDGGTRLELLAAPSSLELPVGWVAFLPVEVDGFTRTLQLTARSPIHTFVNDATAALPGDESFHAAGTIAGAEAVVRLQTLRMRRHRVRLRFTAGEVAVEVAVDIVPRPLPRTPLFGLRLAELYDALEPPYVPIYGPACAGCTTAAGDPLGTTRDRRCAGALADPCACHRVGMGHDAGADLVLRARGPELQVAATQVLRHDMAWGVLQGAPRSATDPAPYVFAGLDWLLGIPPEEAGAPEPPGGDVLDYLAVPTGTMYHGGGWTHCPEWVNPDGSRGFFDPDNAGLLAEYRAYLAALASHASGRLLFAELGNEPQGPFYLCPCTSRYWSSESCSAGAGPNQDACIVGADHPEFVNDYGALLYMAADIAAAELAAADPDVLVVTGAVDQPPFIDGLTLTTRELIARGLLSDHENVAIGIHQYPTFSPPPWLRRGEEPPVACRNDTDWDGGEPGALLNCSYGQEGHAEFWLPCGCETAPPFAGSWQLATGKVLTARDLWRRQDERVDLSPLLWDALDLGVLDLDPSRNRFVMFDTELHAGFKSGDATTSVAREALAGARIGAINAHQWVVGTEFVLPADGGAGSPAVAAYNALVKHLAGATPFFRDEWDVPLIDDDYSGLVVKLFRRGDEDLMAVWSNAATPQRLLLAPAAPGGATFASVTVTRIGGDASGGLAIGVERPAVPPGALTVRPLLDVFFVSVISDRPGFAWLAGLAAAPAYRVRRHLSAGAGK